MKISDNIEIIKTQDGSLGLYNKELSEVFHSIYGAKTEAIEKFINPVVLLCDKPLKILDICYGVGYNTKCAIQKFKNIELIDCIEINKMLVELSFEFDFDEKINKIIKENYEFGGFINFYTDDVRRVIKKLNKKYDIIFHDGFAPHKQPEVWSEDLIFEISEHMHKNSVYCTYNHSKPVLNALNKCGLYTGKTVKDNRIIGTMASFNRDFIKNPHNDFELAQLRTKSAITYKDKDLCLSSQDIIFNRNIEIKNSSLPSLSSFLKANKK